MKYEMDSADAAKRMAEGRLYIPYDPEILKKQFDCLEKLYDFNQTRPHDLELRQTLLKDMFAEIGEGCYIEPPLHANFGGHHVHFGNNVYANFNLTLVDDGHIYVGDKTMIGPNVTIATAGHPIQPTLRYLEMQYNIDVHIGKNVWIGAGSVILPGVTIGDNTVIGAGSIVTKDIPSNVVAVGNPCHVMREIGEHDREYYFRSRKIDLDIPDISNVYDTGL
ncbi:MULTISPECIES: sugar O-acetyltransferase [Sellimonas]|uniref:Acetyltransferase n=1 Tax=Sellimonas caecigallum TaxID=2592333 RepID=A0ABS7L5D2_9FIRM|nr:MULTISPECIES: sugar O-acetyltransferase [Sellimonas]MBY0758236.1 sugar O-acetyltransferase [Sellimonas caecigallum]